MRQKLPKGAFVRYEQEPFVKLDLLQNEKVTIKAQIKQLYLEDDRVLSEGFSGGKDSSCTTALTLEALLEIPKEQRMKTLHILYSDTMMELLPVQVHTYRVLEKIKKFASEHDLPVKVMHAIPDVSERFFSMMIGRGIRPPSQDNRWCTTRLKTQVQERVLYDTFGTEDIETISIVGSRKEESADRAKRLEKNTIDGHLKGHSVYAKSLVFAPIEDFSTIDVWTTLRSSDIGRTVLDAESLFELYATTNGEGAECQTILGNANENGKNPGCSKSGGRFGCWVCTLLPKGGDKAMLGMAKQYPYIKHMIEFRDWVASIRDGNWHKYRDFYNHEHFTRLQYNLDNHRFGMTCPGGLNLPTRAEMLLRLMECETKVREEEDIYLISDEELEYIQRRWVEEGDLSLTAVEICKRYGREVKVTDATRRLVRFAKAFYVTQSIWERRLKVWYNIHPDERFAAQFVLQTAEKHGLGKMAEILQRIVDEEDPTYIAGLLERMQLKKQFYPSEDMKKLILREWETDQVSYVTQMLVYDYEGWPEDVSEDYATDPLENPDVSMEDKYAILDNWNTYVGYDTNERFEHAEYMRFGGQYQYVTFRERQSEENRSKNKRNNVAKGDDIQTLARVQQTFDLFAA